MFSNSYAHLSIPTKPCSRRVPRGILEFAHIVAMISKTPVGSTFFLSLALLLVALRWFLASLRLGFLNRNVELVVVPTSCSFIK